MQIEIPGELLERSLHRFYKKAFKSQTTRIVRRKYFCCCRAAAVKDVAIWRAFLPSPLKPGLISNENANGWNELNIKVSSVPLAKSSIIRWWKSPDIYQHMLGNIVVFYYLGCFCSIPVILRAGVHVQYVQHLCFGYKACPCMVTDAVSNSSCNKSIFFKGDKHCSFN